MTVDEFVSELSAISLPNVFNPYKDVCPVSDNSASPQIRQHNLACFLDSIANGGARSIWLGRDLGYRGGRRTGIALTDEFHLQVLSAAFGVVGLAKATIDEDLKKERTATEVWKLLSRIGQPILLWNAFPFHPFDEDEPFTNRRHTTREFDSCSEILVALIEWLKPDTIIALGSDAQSAVARLGFKSQKVRHPSYGGQTDFAKQICEIYGLPTT
jgi:uracil-DNA glycosylase